MLQHNPAAAPAAAAAAPQAVPAAVAVESDSDSDEESEPDEGDLHHAVLEAGVELDDDGNLNLGKAADLLNMNGDEAGEAVDDEDHTDVEDAPGPHSAAAPPAVVENKGPVRRSARISKGLDALIAYAARYD